MRGNERTNEKIDPITIPFEPNAISLSPDLPCHVPLFLLQFIYARRTVPAGILPRTRPTPSAKVLNYLVDLIILSGA